MTDNEERDNFAAMLGAKLDRSDRAAAESLAYYRLLKERKKLTSVLIYEARCDSRDRCLLLHVFQTPAGPAFYLPRYKLSPEVNARESNADGRRANTEDGNNRWKGQAGLVRPAFNFSLNCDHYRGELEPDDIEGEPGRPTRRTFGN